jgi:hypothetical protein
MLLNQTLGQANASAACAALSNAGRLAAVRNSQESDFAASICGNNDCWLRLRRKASTHCNATNSGYNMRLRIVDCKTRPTMQFA